MKHLRSNPHSYNFVGCCNVLTKS